MYVIDERALSATAAGGTDPLLRELRDGVEIVDALYRFGLGQDLKDRELLASAFAADAELDFRPAAARWGGHPPVMSGRDTIVTSILSMFSGRVDTTHQVTNPRVAVDGDNARLTARERWVIQRLRIDNAWYTGDPLAIFG
jgi:hypothetical protein